MSGQNKQNRVVIIMNIRRNILAVGASSALLVGGALSMASSANAAEPSAGNVDGDVSTMNVTVEVWTPTANIRDDSTTDSAIDRTVTGGTKLEAECWETGQEVTENGITNDTWIYLESGWFDDEYIWAGALKGDSHAGVPDEC